MKIAAAVWGFDFCGDREPLRVRAGRLREWLAEAAGIGAGRRGSRPEARTRRVLGRGRVLRLTLRAGEALACRSGRLWLVREGETRPADIILERGEREFCPRAGTVLVEALRDAVLVIEPS